jgi:GMP synthase-like glutamine amidotransferase
MQGNAYRPQTTLFISIEVTADYLHELKHTGLPYYIHKQRPTIPQMFRLSFVPVCSKPSKKIFLVNFATSQLNEDKLLPKIHLPGLIIGSLFNNEDWTVFWALRDDIPTYAQLLEADAVVIPGSSHSVLNYSEPADRFGKLLFSAFTANPRLKILSICYGHQLVSKLFGAEVVKKRPIQGHERISFKARELRKYKFLRYIRENNNKGKQWLLSEFHEDYVVCVPAGFDLIAKSDSCGVEAMVK